MGNRIFFTTKVFRGGRKGFYGLYRSGRRLKENLCVPPRYIPFALLAVKKCRRMYPIWFNNPLLLRHMQSATKYPDKWMWRYLAPVLAVSAVHIANDNTLWELMQIPSYYTDLLFSFCFTYVSFWYVKQVCVRLDKQHPNTTTRIWKQALLGVVFPTVFIIGGEMAYLVFLLEIPISESPIFYLELPVTVIFLTLVNLLYYIMYLRQHKEILVETVYVREEIPQPTKEPDGTTTNFFVQRGAHEISIPEQQTAYFYVENKCVWLVTFTGEQYLYNHTLDQVQQRLDPNRFFRLNRQYIAHRNSIQKVGYTDTRKLEITLEPKNNEEIFVSKANAGAFQRWWKNAVNA